MAMRRVRSRLVLAWIACSTMGLQQAHAQSAPTPLSQNTTAETTGRDPLPTPEALLPQVEFWKRVYSEIDSSHGFIHDARQMNVVYETVAVPQNLGRRAAARFAKAQVRRIATILQTLARGKRDHLSKAEANVLAQWPEGVDNATLAAAASNVRFQSGLRDRFMAGLLRSRPWMPHIERTLAQYSLPVELAALPHVESSFDMRAYSKAHAAGIWQFTQATARLYMHMDKAVDERYDPIRATEAAARLLAQNYRRIGNWPLAITAYNHGTEGIRRAMQSMHTDDISVIVAHYRTRRFGFASRNFYTELLAAWEVSHHADKYFGTLPVDTSPTVAQVTTDAFYRAGSVARALGVEVAALRANNPALRPAVWTGAVLIPRGFTLRVPQAPGTDASTYLARLTEIPQSERYAQANAAPTNAPMLARATVHKRSGPVAAPQPAPVVPATWDASAPTVPWSVSLAAPVASPVLAPAWVQ